MTHLAHPLNLWRAAGACLLAAALVVGCGGGVGSGGTGSFAAGPITGFGSVIVNGVRFDDNSASVEDGEGGRHNRDELRLGMTVEIDSGAVTAASTGATATASRIRFDSELRGQVGSVDAGGAGFRLLGQQVAVDATTVFAEELGGLGALTPGARVEVFAVYDPARALYRAKRVGMAGSGAPAQLRGPVGALDLAARTLRIGSGNSVYNYAAASAVPANLATGAFVRLRLAAAPLPSGQWSVLSFSAALQALPDVDDARLEGLISSFTSAASFSVNGRPVDASQAAFPDGSAGLAVGVRVKVEGPLRNGTLRATEVEVESDEQENAREFELHGMVQSVNAAAKTFVLRMQTVSTVRPDLRYENGSAANLVVGRQVEVKGLLSADGLRIEATKISFE